ncbi:hypothetical protein GQ651_08520 [Alphaproteobacteria bacterium GH1-50]|uniref:Uncharacterized protein n=1 Tax=Kangsaoukella pontilimi TaxID=2691042 RepID=A0A7C9IFX9_9RHOB|nr:hypothetical protein [Kangsaoukella pontilimi]MXQ07888.1 hypothetical protein [Kangsaoukella pontilimi]
MNSLPTNEIGFFADRSYRIINEILASLSVEPNEASIDKDILLEVSEFFLRDIYRVDKQQRGSVSIAKWAGYWGFWIRKLKPVKMQTLEDDATYKTISIEDAVNINERVAFQFALEIVAGHRKYGGFQDHVYRNCSLAAAGECDGVDCFWKFALRYMNFEDEFFSNYITYSMRNRTFGPHHFALLLENIVFSSCRGLEEKDG